MRMIVNMLIFKENNDEQLTSSKLQPELISEEEEISVETDEANETVINVDVENEDEGSGGENLISKEDFLKLMAKHREESKADRAKFFQDLRKDLWTDR